MNDFMDRWNDAKHRQEAVRQNIVRCSDPDRCAEHMKKSPLNWCCRNGDEFDKIGREMFTPDEM